MEMAHTVCQASRFILIMFDDILDYYKGIFTKAALERITGINQTQLGHYAAGRSKPRKQQIIKIEKVLHKLGEELCGISL
jgi:hypothetical protein